MGLAAHLQEQATNGGRDWASSVRAALRRDGRSLEGGWPGTLSEAHTLALTLFQDCVLDEQQRSELASALYAAARQSWQGGEKPRGRKGFGKTEA